MGSLETKVNTLHCCTNPELSSKSWLCHYHYKHGHRVYQRLRLTALQLLIGVAERVLYLRSVKKSLSSFNYFSSALSRTTTSMGCLSWISDISAISLFAMPKVSPFVFISYCQRYSPQLLVKIRAWESDNIPQLGGLMMNEHKSICSTPSGREASFYSPW